MGTLDWVKIFFTLINDNFLGHYLAALIPISLGLFILAYSILNIAGVIPSIVFLIITTFDQSILDLSFKLFPSNGTLLPLSIIIFLLLKENFRLDNIKIFLLYWFYQYGCMELKRQTSFSSGIAISFTFMVD